MSKQDRQGVRTAAEVEQKYGLGQFMYDQKQKNQDLAKGISNLGDSFSNYKTENEDRFSSMENSFNETINGFSKEIEDLTKGIFNMIYPVGSIYISTSENNPSTLFGGTWERIEDTFLLASGSSYAAGSTGGAEKVSLTQGQLPKITGSITFGTGSSPVVSDLRSANGVFTATGDAIVSTKTNYSMTAYQKVNLAFGNNESHNNMPPYLAVFVWKRTA